RGARPLRPSRHLHRERQVVHRRSPGGREHRSREREATQVSTGTESPARRTPARGMQEPRIMRKTNVFLPAATIMLMAVGAAAQDQPDRTTQPANPSGTPTRDTQPGKPDSGAQPGMRDTQRSMAMQPELIPSEWATGAKVVGADGTKLGKIDDLIIDSGNGRVIYAVLS